MDDYDDDVLDRPDFLQITKKDWRAGKKRKLQECPLDDSLSYKQKTAVDEITYLFPQMSPKTIMTETLRVLDAASSAQKKTSTMKGDLRRQIIIGVEVARQAVQQLAVNSARAQEPAEVMSGRCLQLEREVASLKRQMEMIQKDRDSLLEQVKLLRRELVSDKASLHGKLDHERADRQMAGTSHSSPLGRRVAEDLPPARRSSLRGVSRVIPEDPYARRKLIDERGRIVLSVVNGQEDHHQRGKDLAGWLPSSGPERGEPWETVTGKRRRKKRKKTINTYSGGSRVPVNASEVVALDGSGAKMVRKDVSFAAAVGEARGVATTLADSRVRPKSGTGSAIPPGRAVRRGIRKINSAAVLIRCDEGGPSYAEVMGEARSSVSLEELGITDTRVRRAQTGGLLVEIPGEDAGSKADTLVSRLDSLFKNRTGIKVIRPIRRLEFRLLDLDESVTIREIAEAVAARGNVQSSDVRVGPLRPGRGGLNTVWIQCPVMCAEQILKEGLRIGWSKVRVVPLAKRRLQCYRCFAVGHTRVNCRSAVDRSGVCFNCGREGHTAVGCKAPPHCPVCAGRNLPAGHRAGGDGCVPYNSPIRTATDERTDNSDIRDDVRAKNSSAVRMSEVISPAEERMSVDVPNG